MNFDHVELVMPLDRYEAIIFSGPGRVALGQTFGIEFCGEEIWIGELRGELVDVEVDAEEVEEDGERPKRHDTPCSTCIPRKRSSRLIRLKVI
jgi:hypothetical protein